MQITLIYIVRCFLQAETSLASFINYQFCVESQTFLTPLPLNWVNKWRRIFICRLQDTRRSAIILTFFNDYSVSLQLRNIPKSTTTKKITWDCKEIKSFWEPIKTINPFIDSGCLKLVIPVKWTTIKLKKNLFRWQDFGIFNLLVKSTLGFLFIWQKYKMYHKSFSKNQHWQCDKELKWIFLFLLLEPCLRKKRNFFVPANHFTLFY